MSLKWGRSSHGITPSKCGRFEIIKQFRFKRHNGYKIVDKQAGDFAWRQTLADCKHWAEEAPARAFPRVFHTFSAPPFATGGSCSIFVQPDPSSFNRMVNIVRYKITIERVDEPEEIKARVLKLWRECNNTHHREPIKIAAGEHGVELDPERYGINARPSY